MTDLYEELNAIDLGSEIESLQKRNLQLEKHIKCLEDDIETLCKTITEMKQTQINLSNNISELFKTAKAEIDRKDRLISELQSELDDLKFRRQRNNEPGNNYRKRSREKSPNDCDTVDVKKLKIEEYSNVNDNASHKFDNRDHRSDFQRSKSREFRDKAMESDEKRKRSNSESYHHSGRSRSREYDRIQNDRLKRSRSRNKSPATSHRSQFDRHRQVSPRRQQSPSSHRNYRDRYHNDYRNTKYNRLHENKCSNYQRHTSLYDKVKVYDQKDENQGRNNDRTDKNNEKNEDRQNKDKFNSDSNKFDNENKMVNNRENDKSKNNYNNKIRKKSESEKDKKEAIEKNGYKFNLRHDPKSQEKSESESKVKSSNLKAKQVELFGFDSCDTLLNTPEKINVKVESKNCEEIATNEDTLDLELLEMKYEKLQKEIKQIDENEKYEFSNDISGCRTPKMTDSINSKVDLTDKKTRKLSTSEESKCDFKKSVDKSKIKETHMINEPTEVSKKLKSPLCRYEKLKSVNEKLSSKNYTQENCKKTENMGIKSDNSKSELHKRKKISLEEYNNKNLKIKLNNIQSESVDKTQKIDNTISDNAKSIRPDWKDDIPKTRQNKTPPNKNNKKKERSLDMISLWSPVKSKNIENTNDFDLKNVQVLSSDKVKKSTSNLKTVKKSLDMKNLVSPKKTHVENKIEVLSNEIIQEKYNSKDELQKNSLSNKHISKKNAKSLDMISLFSPTKSQIIDAPKCNKVNPPKEELNRQKTVENILDDQMANIPAESPDQSYGVTHEGEIPTLHLDDQHFIPVVTNFDSTQDQCNFMKLLDANEANLDENNKISDKLEEIVVSAAPRVIEKTETSTVQNGANSIASDSSSKKENISATPTKIYNLKRGRIVLSFRN